MKKNLNEQKRIELNEDSFTSKTGASNISPEEWQARIDLAAMYRLAAEYGYDDLIWNHITMRVPNTDHQFLLNKFGLLYNEVTASNLIKVDENGAVLYGPKNVNTAGFVIHSAIHLAHPNMKVVFHAHAPAGLAVTALKNGLDYLVQDTSMLYGDIGYHDWEGLSLTLEERKSLAKNIEGKSCLIMRNHGFLTVGETAGEAFMNMHYLIRACRVMIDAYATGLELDKGPKDIWDLSRRQYADFPPGKYEWPALLRQLDRKDPSYKH
jgi:ribulose-5-phosphate 4-epimerase/fuculose-1-phosphate aldolase